MGAESLIDVTQVVLHRTSAHLGRPCATKPEGGDGRPEGIRGHEFGIQGLAPYWFEIEATGFIAQLYKQ